MSPECVIRVVCSVWMMKGEGKKRNGPTSQPSVLPSIVTHPVGGLFQACLVIPTKVQKNASSADEANQQ